MKITIDQEITSLTSNFSVGVMTCNVETNKGESIDSLIQSFENNVNEEIDIKDVVNMDIIIDGRNAYKTYGKDPSRYRLAVESLYRRLAKGNKLYRINNVVDLGNILSLYTRKSVAVLDYDKIQGDILIRLGKETDEYEGIGRGKLNISKIPLYEDEIGPFGSVTSDTTRTMITNSTTKILLFIISFSGSDSLEKELKYCVDIYSKHASATNIETYVLKNS